MQEPYSRIHCEKDCQLYTSVPVINEQGNIAVITMSASLIDVIFSLNKSLKSEVAVISVANNQNLSLQSASFISTSNRGLAQKLFALPYPELPRREVMKEGMEFSNDDTHYLLNFLPLSSYNTRDYYLVLIDDVSEFKQKNEYYQRLYF